MYYVTPDSRQSKTLIVSTNVVFIVICRPTECCWRFLVILTIVVRYHARIQKVLSEGVQLNWLFFLLYFLMGRQRGSNYH